MTQVLQMFGWFCFGSTSMFIMLIMLIVLLVVLLAQCQSGGLLADTGTADVWNRIFTFTFSMIILTHSFHFHFLNYQVVCWLTGTADVWNRPVAAVEDRVAAAVPIVHGILNPPQ